MIRPPPLLLGVSTVFWGYHCDQLVLSAAVAGILESTPVLKFRLHLTATDFRRILIFSILGLLVISAYFLTTRPIREALVALLQWLPLVILPTVATQRYSSVASVDWKSVLTFLASSAANYHPKPAKLDLGYLYVALCLVAASAANMRTPWFYAAIVLICGWSLWSVRSRRHSPFVWGGLFLVAAGLGFSAHIALNHLQQYVTEATVELFVGGGGHTDPYSNTTRLGRLGTLKLSDRILLRVYPESRFTPPLLLHRASYDRYLYGEWIAKDATLRPVTPGAGGEIWTLKEHTKPSSKILLSEYLDQGTAVLALPHGTVKLRHLPAYEFKKNRLDTVQIKGAERLVTYEVLYKPNHTGDALPTDYDLKIPPTESETLSRFALELGAEGLSAKQMLQNIKTFFADNFAYSLSQENPINVKNALREFLTKTRTGHCEYFATATVLLLRAAGIPARYATGFSVQEYSNMEKAYVVRLRHAHAWARAYIDGEWIDVDTTPTTWADVEQDNASLWQPLMDLGSWLWFKYADWRIQKSSALLKALSITLVVLALGCLAWWVKRKRSTRAQNTAKSISSPLRRWPGSDSEFCLIEQKLNSAGLERKQGEPLYTWLKRLSDSETIPSDAPALIDLASLHYRFRFSPEGIDQNERCTLAGGVRDWLHGYERRLKLLKRS